MDKSIGVKVSVRLEHGDALEGWLHAETSDGIYVSLDPKGKDIRYIPRRDLSSFTYDYKASRAPFEDDHNVEAVEAAERFDDELSGAVNERLSRVDYNRVRRIAAQLRTDRDQLQHIARESVQYPSGFEVPPSLVLRLTSTYSDLLDEIEKSGLEDILGKYDERIASFVSMDTLPLVDSGVAERYEIRDMILLVREKKQSIEINSSRRILTKITPESVVATEEEPAGSFLLRWSSGTRKKRKRSLRKVAALGKIALGGSLTATNVALGITAGVVTALPTLGVGTVGAAAGIVVSAYTGMNNAFDGLKDYDSIREEAIR